MQHFVQPFAKQTRCMCFWTQIHAFSTSSSFDQCSLQRAAGIDVHQLQYVFVVERLQTALACLRLKDRQCVVIVACCQIVHNEAVHEAVPQCVAAWNCCMNAALLLLEL